MTTQEREVMQMALDALEHLQTDIEWQYKSPTRAMLRKVEKALRAALAQPEPEPWGYISHKSWKMPVFVEADDLQAANLPFNNPDYTPVYKAPPQREWQGLTDEERAFLAWESENGPDCVEMTEFKLWEKNR